MAAEFGGEWRERFGRGDPAVGGAIQRHISGSADDLQPGDLAILQDGELNRDFPFFMSGARADSGMMRYQFSRTSCSTRAR